MGIGTMDGVPVRTSMAGNEILPIQLQIARTAGFNPLFVFLFESAQCRPYVCQPTENSRARV